MTAWTPINVAKAILLTAAGLAVIAVLLLVTIHVGSRMSDNYYRQRREAQKNSEWRPKSWQSDLPAKDGYIRTREIGGTEERYVPVSQP